MSKSGQPPINSSSLIENSDNWWGRSSKGTKVVIVVIVVIVFLVVGFSCRAIGGLSGGSSSIDTNSKAYNDGYYYGTGNIGSLGFALSVQGKGNSCIERFNLVLSDPVYTDGLTDADKDNFIAGCEKKQSGQ